MNKNEILDTIKKAREGSKKRNFSQSLDVVFNLKDLDLKKPDHKVKTFVSLPKGRGKAMKVCALVGGSLHTDAKENCNLAIIDSDFGNYDKKAIKKVIEQNDFFIAQADIMPKIAKSFGRFLGVAGKMPNPKAGQIVPPKGSTKTIVEKMQKTVVLVTKNELAVKCSFGMEDMKDEDLVENFMTVHKELINVLPLHEQNIRSVVVKMTMGKPVLVGGEKQ